MKSLDIKTIAKEVIQIEAEAVSQIQKQINIPLPTIRDALNKLIELDKIELRGQGRGSRYVLKDLNFLALNLEKKRSRTI